MFVDVELRDTKVSKQKRIKEKGNQGDTCHLCQVPYPKLEDQRIDFSKMIGHHKRPLANGGKSAEENMLYLCNYCDDGMHLFLDAFRVLDVDVDYEFLTTAYIWLFAKKPSQELRTKYPLSAYKYKGSKIKDYGVTQFAKKFRGYSVKNGGLETSNLSLFYIYLRDLRYYDELSKSLRGIFNTGFSGDSKENMINFNELLNSDNVTVRSIAHNYKYLLTDVAKNNLKEIQNN